MARKNFILCVLISTLIMLVLPWLAVTFVKSDAGMAVCFICRNIPHVRYDCYAVFNVHQPEGARIIFNSFSFFFHCTYAYPTRQYMLWWIPYCF